MSSDLSTLKEGSNYQTILDALKDSPPRQKVAELKMRARELFSKYIEEGSIYEINIPFKCRRNIADALTGDESIEDPVWDEDEELNQLLNLFAVFARALQSQYQLLQYSFSRFKQNPAYERLSQIMQEESS